MTAADGRTEELERALRSLVPPTLAEQGCLQYELHVDESDPQRFVLIERWSSMESLEAHRQSTHLQAFREKVPSLLHGPPTVQVLTSLTPDPDDATED